MNIELVRAALEWAKNGKRKINSANIEEKNEDASPNGSAAKDVRGSEVDAVANGEGESHEVREDGGSEESV